MGKVLTELLIGGGDHSSASPSWQREGCVPWSSPVLHEDQMRRDELSNAENGNGGEVESQSGEKGWACTVTFFCGGWWEALLTWGT